MNKEFTIYIVRDDNAEDAFYYNNYEELRGMYYTCETFSAENDAERFIDGLFYGLDERSPAEFIVLREWCEDDAVAIKELLTDPDD